jgi:chorismate synthase
MSGNLWGSVFKITTFGESHGVALGVVIDGMPSKILFNPEKLKADLKKRSPGNHPALSPRQEDDEYEILSGLFENQTLGTPISVIVRNKNQKSDDYEWAKTENRPGHADKTYQQKYGIRDYRGGGRASGRETVSRVIAGHFASLIIPQIKFKAAIIQLGPYEFHHNFLNSQLGALNLSDSNSENEITNYLLNLKAQGESCGGAIRLYIENVPAGLGEPVFDKLKADLAKAMMSIGGVIGFTLGNAFLNTKKLGSELSQNTQNFSGIEGGISNGEIIVCDIFMKAPSTIGDKAKNGRHDPCLLPRAVSVIEAMAKIVIADHFLRHKIYKD